MIIPAIRNSLPARIAAHFPTAVTSIACRVLAKEIIVAATPQSPRDVGFARGATEHARHLRTQERAAARTPTATVQRCVRVVCVAQIPGGRAA